MITLAVLPVFTVIIAGYLCKRFTFPSESFWESAERFIYFLLLPVLFFKTTATSDVSAGDIFTVPLIAGGAILIIATLLVLFKRIITKSGPSFTSVFQGVTRFNSYVGLSLVLPMFGKEGLVVMAISIGLLVPFINVLTVFILSIYGTNATFKLRTIGYRIITNPLVLSSGGGLLFNYLGLTLHSMLFDMLDIIAKAALPMGLMTVGASLQLRALKDAGHLVLLAGMLKLLALPAVTFGLCHFFAISENSTAVALLFAALPSATSSYILARQLGGNKELMAHIIATETLAAAFTIPLVMEIGTRWF